LKRRSARKPSRSRAAVALQKNDRVTRNPISVALTVALLTGCSTALQTPTETASTQPIATPTASPTPSPSVEPTPTPTSAGELVLRITYQYFASYWRSISLVADGRLTSPSESGWKVRVLSQNGVEWVRAEVVRTGLFAESADYPLVPVPNQDVGCMDGLGLTYSSAIELVTDEGPVIVSWQRAGGPDGCWEPTASRLALELLLAKLESPDKWLPPDSWQDQTLRPYEPHGYRLITIAQPWQQAAGEDLPEASSVSWPLADSLTTFGEAFTPRVYADTWTVRCAGVSPDEAELVVDALTDAGATITDSSPSGFASGTLLRDRSTESMVAVILEALPVGMTGCAQLELEFLNCWQLGTIQPFYCAIP